MQTTILEENERLYGSIESLNDKYLPRGHKCYVYDELDEHGNLMYRAHFAFIEYGKGTRVIAHFYDNQVDGLHEVYDRFAEKGKWSVIPVGVEQ